MTTEPKQVLQRYLQQGREVLLWKLDGVSEYDARRPLVPSGTNLLGIVKHVASVESEYFGACLGRSFPEELPWSAPDAEPNADMWALESESRESIVALYRRVWVHSDATIDATDLDATATVPWWGEANRHPTLHTLLVHMVAETHRHAGHADIVRELVDGSAGHRDGGSNLPGWSGDEWAAHRARLEETAARFR